jgi:hypothetical protein
MLLQHVWQTACNCISAFCNHFAFIYTRRIFESALYEFVVREVLPYSYHLAIANVTLLKVTAVGEINDFESREAMAVSGAYQRLRFANILFLH